MHIHITLIGGQPTPVLSVIDALCPDEIVAIYSKDSKDKLDFIKTYLDESMGFKAEEVDPYNSTLIQQKFSELAKRYENVETLTVNISSGTKAWSFFAQKEMQGLPNVKFYYIDPKTNTLYNLTDMKSEPVVPFNVDEQDSDFTRLSKYSDKELQDLAVIEDFRAYNFFAFLALTDKKNKNLPTFTVSDDRGNKMSFTHNEADKCYELSASKPGKAPFVETLSSPRAQSLLFNTGWFEFKVAKLIEACSWKNAKGEEVRPTNIRLNNVFKDSKGSVMNEIDIRFDADGRQFFVEVKTSAHDTTDLDKFIAVVERVAGSAALKLFVSEGSIKNTLQEKCDKSNIRCYRTQYSDGMRKGQAKDDATLRKELSETLRQLADSSNI